MLILSHSVPDAYQRRECQVVTSMLWEKRLDAVVASRHRRSIRARPSAPRRARRAGGAQIGAADWQGPRNAAGRSSRLWIPHGGASASANRTPAQCAAHFANPMAHVSAGFSTTLKPGRRARPLLVHLTSHVVLPPLHRGLAARLRRPPVLHAHMGRRRPQGRHALRPRLRRPHLALR